MNFFKKLLKMIKELLGIGGAKVKMEIPKEVKRDSGEIKGTLIFSTKDDPKTIKEIEIQLKEVWKVGKDEDAETKVLTLGGIELKDKISVKFGEEKTLNFTLPFKYEKSDNDKLMDSGKVGKGLGKLGKLMDGEKSTFTVEMSGSVEGQTFGVACNEDIILTVN